MTADAHDAHKPATEDIDRLRDLALLDELTGLANRRAFLERLQRAFADARADRSIFSLALMDLDGLKDINDTFGYTAGDEALRAFARALRDSTGSSALVARIGGDEFAVVTPCASPKEAQAQADQLQAVAHGVVRPLKDGAPDVILSAAFGMSIWEPSMESAMAVFTAAEAMMVAAKAAPPPSAAAEAFRPRGRRALGEELRSLLAMARQVSSTSGMSDLLRRVIEQAAALVGAEAAAIALVGDGSIRLDEVWQHGAWHPFHSARPLGEGVLGRTAASGQPELHNTLTHALSHDWPGATVLLSLIHI
jgi:diguanylate cyclase (GGDEF)-like protein